MVLLKEGRVSCMSSPRNHCGLQDAVRITVLCSQVEQGCSNPLRHATHSAKTFPSTKVARGVLLLDNGSLALIDDNISEPCLRELRYG